MAYLTVEGVMREVGITRKYVYAGLRAGRLRGVKFAGCWRFRQEWVEAWVEGRPLPLAPIGGVGIAEAAAHTKRMLELRRARTKGAS